MAGFVAQQIGVDQLRGLEMRYIAGQAGSGLQSGVELLLAHQIDHLEQTLFGLVLLGRSWAAGRAGLGRGRFTRFFGRCFAELAGSSFALALACRLRSLVRLVLGRLGLRTAQGPTRGHSQG